MKTLLLTLALALSGRGDGNPDGTTPGAAPVNGSATASPGDGAAVASLQVHAKEIVRADGSRVEAILVIADGKIARLLVGGELDPRVPSVEHDGVVTAGWIACQSGSGEGDEATDNTRSVLPDARLVHAFRPSHSDFERALRAGITSMVLNPGDVNLVGGRTAVVKTHGGVVLSPAAHLALSFSGTSLIQNPGGNPSGGFVSPVDGGLEYTDRTARGSRSPTSYAGALAELNARFDEGAGVFGAAARGELPVYIEAWDRNEVARAALFAKERKLKGALRGAPLAGDPALVPLLKESGLAVVVGPFGVGQARRSLESVRELQTAGVPVAFALDAPNTDPEGFRLSAALAVAAGADARGVLASLTSVGARVAGVADRVGTLEAGQDADFVLWSGDPLDLSSKVLAVYVDGALAWSAAAQD